MSSQQHASTKPISIQLPIEGMSCASCVGRVERVLKRQPNVMDAQVNLATETATIETMQVDVLALIEAIEKAGYQVPMKSQRFLVAGMTCASCVARVEKVLKRVPNVIDARVNLATEEVVVDGFANEAELFAAVKKAGYEPRALQGVNKMDALRVEHKQQEWSVLKRDTLWAFLLTLPVFVMEMGGHAVPVFHHWLDATLGTHNSWLMQFVLTTLVLLFPGRRFLLKGIPALVKGAPDMNSLVAVGSLAAYSYSVVATFLPSLLPQNTVHVYFEAAAVIVTLILLGRLLEAQAKGKTSAAIQRLMGLQAKTARVKRADQWVDVPISEVQPGEVLEVKPGERIAVDGVVVSGSSYVDEAMITGEPMAVFKQAGSQLTGATINQNGRLEFKATAVGEATVLAQIIRMISEAQGAKLPIQTAVDKVTQWFVPVVMLLAVMTFVFWYLFGPEPKLTYAVVNAVAVLIIACPCAMGLATPTSIMVATGRGAEMGVLFRKGDALQTLQQIKVVAVDKTGTLTLGKPVLTDLLLQDAYQQEQVLPLIAAAEQASEHPIAQALVDAAQGMELPAVESFEALTGLGIRAQVAGQRVDIGSARYMQQLTVDVGSFSEAVLALSQEGKTPFYVAIDGKLAAAVAVSDPIKETTPKAIKALHEMGMKVVMISGDQRHTAEVIAKQLGIDEVIAEVLPEGKVAAVKHLQSTHQVAFIGDGINDAPALAQADIGLAVGTGTDIAIESADVVLMSGRLTAVSDAMALSRATIRNIHQNLFWAFAYNIALIPVAAGVLYPKWGILLSPMLAASAMALSSVFVLSNALRLHYFKASVA